MEFMSLNKKVCIIEQIEKIREEDEEFIRAVENLDKRNMIEEFYDSIQAKLTLMEQFGITIEELEFGEIEHLVKLKGRGHTLSRYY